MVSTKFSLIKLNWALWKHELFAADCIDADGNPVSGEPFRNPDDCTTFFQVSFFLNKFDCKWHSSSLVCTFSTFCVGKVENITITKINKKISNLYYSRGITLKRVTSSGPISICPWLNASATHLRSRSGCEPLDWVRLDQPGNRTPELWPGNGFFNHFAKRSVWNCNNNIISVFERLPLHLRLSRWISFQSWQQGLRLAMECDWLWWKWPSTDWSTKNDNTANSTTLSW